MSDGFVYQSTQKKKYKKIALELKGYFSERKGFVS
tara:strand:+ start:78421 stop:78525 length:105 start_codon:yes stop_codon:yes gene_type:complete